MNVIALRPRLRAALVASAALAFAAVTLVGASAADATPPQLLTVSEAGGHVTVSWQLPADGSTSFRVQIATAPDAGGDGEFFSENVVAQDILADGQTRWADVDQLPAGLYYVHVSDSNLSCQADDSSDCYSEQWSQTETVQIPLNAAFAWGTSRNGHIKRDKAIAGGLLVLTTWNPNGSLPVGTKGVCTESVNLILYKTTDRNVNGQWTCAYRLPAKLAGKHITVTLDVVFGTTGAFLHQTISATVTRPQGFE
jgi:hypothetical protein